MQPFQGCCHQCDTVTQGALLTSRPWAVISDPFGVGVLIVGTFLSTHANQTVTTQTHVSSSSTLRSSHARAAPRTGRIRTRQGSVISLPTDQIHRFARTISEGKRVSFWWTMGVNQSHQGTRTAQAIINLALMTGSIGKPGTGANSITGQCNAMGSRLFSNTTNLLGDAVFDPYSKQPSYKSCAVRLRRA